MFVKTNDPLLSQQWHLDRIGLGYVFNDYRGAGVRVGVFDNGVQAGHSDLKQNYHAALGSSSGGADGGKHGTAVAGIIAAAANDGQGGMGVASSASLAGVDVFGASNSGSGVVSAMQRMGGFDVVNHSWGWSDRYSDGAATAFGASFLATIDAAVTAGRGGLGTIIVNSAGNDWLTGRVDANSSAFNSSRETITVGAVTDIDVVASYSNRGASLLVSAPSSGGGRGITTTDLEGAAGYSAGDYTTTFGGTSAAAPIVSGVVALVLEADPSLGWRDVQSILALSARHVGSAMTGGTGGSEAYGWTLNGATTFNNGGYHFSNDYGFGMVDARAAVRLAEVWKEFGPAAKSSNEISAAASVQPSKMLADNGMTSFSTRLEGAIELEHVELTLNLTHSDVNQLKIELVSPSGTVSEVLATGRGTAQSKIDWTWTFGSNAFRGESAAGEWTVRITDTVTGSVGMVKTAKVEAFGAVAEANDVYHFTESFGAMAAGQVARTLLSDSDGGFDWINAAATTSGVKLDLASGMNSWVAGGAFSIAAGSVIEGAIGGDGDDILLGNDADNVFIGGRGADIFGFRGGSFGQDTIRDFHKGEDKIAFSGGPNHAGEIAFVATGSGTKLVYGGASILLEGATGIDAADLLFAVDFAGLSPRAYQDLV